MQEPGAAEGRVIVAVLIVAGVFVAGLVYFLPVGIAMLRGHPDTLAIAAVNVLLGCTAVGWIVAFVWALTGVRREGNVRVYIDRGRRRRDDDE
jgi:ABC-type transport system involved in cytochrome c biogenesis permease component